MFVDVGVYLSNEGRSLNRALVIKDRDGQRHVRPDPFASPLLSQELNEERASSLDFSGVHGLEN